MDLHGLEERKRHPSCTFTAGMNFVNLDFFLICTVSIFESLSRVEYKDLRKDIHVNIITL